MSVGTISLNNSRSKIRPKMIAKKRALVVDDSITILHAICTLLEHYEVVEIVGRAESGPEAIAIVTALQPELVLLDADMPGMSGLRTALLILQMEPQTEIVLMSMDTSAQFRSSCAACGAAAIIYKPRFLPELRTFLGQAPQRAGTMNGLGAQAV